MAKAESVQIFGSSAEKLSLALPVGFLASLPVFVLFGRAQLNLSEMVFGQWIAAFLGLNFIHNAFSISIFYLPEMKVWLIEQSRALGQRVALRIFVSALVILVFFQVQYFYHNFEAVDFIHDHSWQPILYRVIVGLQIFFLIKHNSSQMFGLSILYNLKYLQNFSGTSRQREGFIRVEKWERFFYRAFDLLVPVLCAVDLAVGDFYGRAFFNWVALGLAAAINIVVSFYPADIGPGKRIFQLRAFLLALSFYSSWALIGAQSVHGVEYTLLYRKMVGNSVLQRRSMVLWITLALCMVVALVSLPRPRIGFDLLRGTIPNMAPIWLWAAMGLSFAISYFHFYLDSKIFHFSDPVTRKNIAPLLY